MGADPSCAGSRPGHCAPGTPVLAMAVAVNPKPQNPKTPKPQNPKTTLYPKLKTPNSSP